MRPFRPASAPRALLVGALLVSVLVGSGGGCFLDSTGQAIGGGGSVAEGGGGGQGGAPPACETAADCSSPSVCRVFECNRGACENLAARFGTRCGDTGTEVCDGEGACLLIDGETCAAEGECASGFCADAVCCATACAGPCNSCALRPAGACTLYEADTDPEEECEPAGLSTGVCDGASACANGATVASVSFADDARTWAVAAYASGDFAIGGDFDGTLTIGDPLPVTAGGNNRDAFVARLGADGTPVWRRGFGLDADQTVWALATDSADATLVVGQFAGSIDLGGGPIASQGLTDAFLVKLDAAGDPDWALTFGDPTDQAILGVGVDADDAVYIAGQFSGTITIGDDVLTSTGANDLFVAKLGADGTPVWARQFGDVSNQVVTGFATNAAGESAVTGIFDGTIDFDGDAVTSPLGFDGFVAKIGADGVAAFGDAFGDIAPQAPHASAIDAAGNVAIAGGYAGTIAIGDDVHTAAAKFDVFVATYGPTGTPLWSRSFGGPEDEAAYGVAFDASGNVAIMGDMNGSADFGSGLLTADDFDVFAAKFSAGGVELWSHLYGAMGKQFGNSLAVDPNNSVGLVGHFEQTLDFGGAPLVSGGPPDVYFARLEP